MSDHKERKCFWCSGAPLVCILCEKEIVCMFCGGTGAFAAEPKFPAHTCEPVCGKCGGTGEVCYSSTSYGPCPECVERNTQ